MARVEGQRVILDTGKEIPIDQAYTYLWQMGIVAGHRLFQHQLPLYERIVNLPPNTVDVIVCSRRFGKTMTVLTVIEEIARQKLGSVSGEPVIIRVAFPGKGQGQGVLIPNWNIVLETCPVEQRPVEDKDGSWVWPNGSRLYIIGTDDSDQREKHRGGTAHWIFIDEAGSHKEFDYLVSSILSPQLDTTHGRMVMITTPPLTMDHGFVRFWATAEWAGNSCTKTIFDNTSYSRGDLKAICARANPGREDEDIESILDAGVDLDTEVTPASPTWEREYLCRMISDSSLKACPRFSEARHVREVKLSPAGRHFVFIDQGHARDFFAAVFCTYDLVARVLVVEDEWQKRRQTTDTIVTALRAKEHALWKGASVQRFSGDTRGQQQLADMMERNYFVAVGPKSDGPETEAGALDVALAEGRLAIDPRCVDLIKQLKDGCFEISQSGRKADYKRTKEMGHLDALSALAAGLPCVPWSARPPDHPIPRGENFMPVVASAQRSPQAKGLLKIFGGLR